jgi:ParB-like chromosome segregation protein Spo0J
MNVTRTSIDEIRPYSNNPRVIAKSVDAVAESIRRYGFLNPILVDRQGVIIAGHTRYWAARKLGLAEVPVIYLDLPEDKAREYRIADNATADISEWDPNKLLAELRLCDGLTEWFDEGELERLAGSLDRIEVDEVKPEDVREAEEKVFGDFRHAGAAQIEPELIHVTCEGCGKRFAFHRHVGLLQDTSPDDDGSKSGGTDEPVE